MAGAAARSAADGSPRRTPPAATRSASSSMACIDAVHPGQVEHLPRHRERPQLGLQPGVVVGEVGGDVAEPHRPVTPQGQVVGSPVRGERGIEGVGEQHGIVLLVGQMQRLDRERSGSARFVRVGPAPGQRCREPRAETGRRPLRRPRAGGPAAARGQVVLLAAGEPEHRRGSAGRSCCSSAVAAAWSKGPWRPRRRRRPRPARPGPAATSRTLGRLPWS